jgi:hypothetical protein
VKSEVVGFSKNPPRFSDNLPRFSDNLPLHLSLFTSIRVRQVLAISFLRAYARMRVLF